MRHEDTDWFGLTMAVRAGYGEPRLAWYGQADTHSGKVIWHRMDHVLEDGTGAMARMLREQGHQIGELPRGDSKEPPPGRRASAWWECVRHIAYRRVPWRVKRLKRPPMRSPLEQAEPPGEDAELCWHVFTPQESRQIDRNALKHGASAYAYMLACLNRVVARHLLKPGRPYHWMVPTNLRGSLGLPDPYGNHVSVLSLKAHADMPAAEMQKQLRDLLNRGHDWAFYWTLRWLGKYPPRIVFRWIQQYMGRFDHMVGCLTDIGHWRWTRPHTANPDEGWFLTPMVSRNNPVSAGTLVFNGRRSIALALHPVLDVPFETVQAMFDAWREALLETGAGSASPEVKAVSAA